MVRLGYKYLRRTVTVVDGSVRGWKGGERGREGRWEREVGDGRDGQGVKC